MPESRILTNTPYTITNRSNYDIVVEETREIVDVPFFPAQNLVDVTGNLDFYKPAVQYYIPFVDQYNQQRLFALFNRVDARFTFLEFANNARYLQYSFGGSSFPQGREGFSLSYDGHKLYIYGGRANGRCMNDIWQYDIRTNVWDHVNYSSVELDATKAPPRRKNSSFLIQGRVFWIFGGETDILTINQSQAYNTVTLADLWSFDLDSKTWTKYDRSQTLPNRTGHVIYADFNTIKVLIKGGVNEIGVTEVTGIYTIDILTDEVTFAPYTPPFTVGPKNILLTIDGILHVLAFPYTVKVFTGMTSAMRQLAYDKLFDKAQPLPADLYQWDSNGNEFVLVKADISAINPIDKKYWVVSDVSRAFGGNNAMGGRTISDATIKDYNTDSVLDVRTIDLMPSGLSITRVNLDNMYTFFYGGMIASSLFNSSTYILNHTTLAVSRYDFPAEERPTERVFASMAYDKYQGRVYLFGGFDGTKFYNDLWYFDLSTHVWVEVHAQLENTDEDDPVYPQPRQKAGMAVTDEKYLYIISGYSDLHCFNDLWRYDLVEGSWTKMYLIEQIPWGSAYFIFEWRDSLFLYNGYQLYRYYDEHKQFALQPFLVSTDTGNLAGTDEDDPAEWNRRRDPDRLQNLLKQKRFLENPIRVTMVNDYLFVQNPQTSFHVELETRVITDLIEYLGMDKSVGMTWLDRYVGFRDDGGSAYYLNVSTLQPLTKNQIPHSYFHKRINEIIPKGLFYKDITTMETSLLTYRDDSGEFVIQAGIDPLEKAPLILNRVIGYAALQSEDAGFDFDDLDSWWDKTIGVLAEPTTYPYAPWFLYKKFVGIDDMTLGAQRVLYNRRKKRLYIIYDNGNILKLNPTDNTFFVYFSRIWKGAAIGYHEEKNKIYAFGGFRDPEKIDISIFKSGAELLANDKPIYAQGGTKVPRQILWKRGLANGCETTHGGFITFDLTLNEMNVGTIESFIKNKKMASVDYSITKTYLVNIVRKYLLQYENKPSLSNLDDIKSKIYTTTQPLLDDVSTADFHFDDGIRPTGRVFTANAQVGNKLYIFGGCECFYNKCDNEAHTHPYWCTRPGRIKTWIGRLARHSFWDLGDRQDDSFFPETVAARKAEVNAASVKTSYFDMDTEAWVPIADMPEWRYMASAIASPDNRSIYIVGGYTAEMVPDWDPPPPLMPSNEVIVYSVNNNTYEKIKGIPCTYAGRAQPLLTWLDDNKLLIMYGFRTLDVFRKDKYCQHYYHFHLPVDDAWIYDRKHHVFYRAFRDLCGITGIIAKDQFYTNQTIKNQSHIYVLTPTPEYNSFGEVVLKLYEWSLVDGSIKPMEVIPTSEIQKDFSGFSGVIPNPKESQTAPDPTITGNGYDGTESTNENSIPGIPGLGEAFAPPPPQVDPDDSYGYDPGNPEGRSKPNKNDPNFKNMELTGEDLENMMTDIESDDIDYQMLFLSMYKNSNFRFRYAWLQEYGPKSHRTMFIIGERCEDSGINAVRRMILGYSEADFRAWYVDIDMPDGWRVLKQVVYAYPLAVSPTIAAYDGKQYLYCIYNKYNIWRLDFTGMLADQEGSHWTRLPPCLDGNFLGDTRSDPGWDGFFTPPNYLTLVAVDGRVARMNVDTCEWSLDKAEPPADPISKKVPEIATGATYVSGLAAATGVDNDEIYMYTLGGISGKVMNIFQKQWDNFFFDMRATSDVVKFFAPVLGKKTWPSLIRRKRLYIINHLGHIFYSWLRIDGQYDVEFQLHDFYQADEIRVYCDHTFLMNWTNISVQVFTALNGWVTIDHDFMQAVENEVDWGWDSNFMRQYVRVIIDVYGNPKYQYTKCPPNFLSIDLAGAVSNQPVSHIRVAFKNTPTNYNYMSRINKVELISNQSYLAEYETPSSPSPLEVLVLDPMLIEDAYTAASQIVVKNTGSQTLNDVIAYVFNNDWVQFTATPTVDESWVRCNPGIPFEVASSIASGDSTSFYLRGVNITDRPQIKDLVIKGVYPYSGD